MRINSIKYNNSHVDGPGIRTVLFMQKWDAQINPRMHKSIQGCTK